MFHFPNNILTLRKKMPHHELAKASGLGAQQIKQLELRGLDKQLPKKKLEALAAKLGHPFERVFPEKMEPKPSVDSPPQIEDVVEELIHQQTQVIPNPGTNPNRQRKVRLLEPQLFEDLWEVHLDVVIANRAIFQELVSAAEALDGWRSETKQVIRVVAGRKIRGTGFLFKTLEQADQFYTEFSGYAYTPEPPPPVVEIRQEIASQIPSPQEETETSEDGDSSEDRFQISLTLTATQAAFYKELKKAYGSGLDKAIVVRGLVEMAQDFNL